MSERLDRKLTEVVVARYSWRHEAEFAAGFLEDADIWHRLQVDDPGLGVSLGGGGAQISVLGMDEARAREVLEIDGHTPRLSGLTRSANHPTPERTRPSVPPRATGSLVSEEPRLGVVEVDEVLPARERLLSVLAAIGVAALGQRFFAESGSYAVQALLAAVVILLIFVGLIGRAPGFLKKLLGAISGNAP